MRALAPNEKKTTENFHIAQNLGSFFQHHFAICAVETQWKIEIAFATIMGMCYTTKTKSLSVIFAKCQHLLRSLPTQMQFQPLISFNPNVFHRNVSRALTLTLSARTLTCLYKYIIIYISMQLAICFHFVFGLSFLRLPLHFSFLSSSFVMTIVY